MVSNNISQKMSLDAILTGELPTIPVEENTQKEVVKKTLKYLGLLNSYNGWTIKQPPELTLTIYLLENGNLQISHKLTPDGVVYNKSHLIVLEHKCGNKKRTRDECTHAVLTYVLFGSINFSKVTGLGICKNNVVTIIYLVNRENISVVKIRRVAEEYDNNICTEYLFIPREDLYGALIEIMYNGGSVKNQLLGKLGIDIKDIPNSKYTGDNELLLVY